jgi:pimeloyl-ACP methyl ester carboxylesterase
MPRPASMQPQVRDSRDILTIMHIAQPPATPNLPANALRSLHAPDGARLAYCASAPRHAHGALVLLHGLASNHTRWSEFAANTALRDGWTLLRPDLRGQGASVYRGRIDMAQWCADLAALLDAELFAKAVLVGHCLGANLALAFAARYPERTAGLVLIEPMPPEALTGTLRYVRELRSLVQLLIPMVRMLNALGLHRRKLPSFNLQQLDLETRAALSRGAQGEAQLAKYASPLADLHTTATGAYLQALLCVMRPLPALERITVPVLALLSQHSSFTDPAITRGVLRRLPDCEIQELPARHWIPTEQPEAMRAAIDTWIQRRFPP